MKRFTVIAVFLLLALHVTARARTPSPDFAIHFLAPHADEHLEAKPTAGSFYKQIADMEVSGGACMQLCLEADGLNMGGKEFHDKETLVHATLPWWPWHGNGTYTLKAFARELWTDSFSACATVTVEVAGIARDAITPENRFYKIFREQFGIDPRGLPVTRFTDWSPINSCWISAAYIGGTMYQVYVFDDGSEELHARPINRETGVFTNYLQRPITRPAGTYTMLVTLFDAGNLGVTREEALDALKRAGADANKRWADYARGIGLKAPFFQIKITPAYARRASDPNLLMPANATVKALTGYDPTNFDMYAQVDINKDKPYNTEAMEAGGLSFEGYAGHGAGGPNLWAWAETKEGLYGTICWTLLDHELAHCLGWQHTWPVGMGGAVENMEFKSVWPALLFGWTDRDGDGVIEILDPTPYGIKDLPRVGKK